MALETSAKARKAGATSDTYTAFLGLAILALVGTVGLVCYQAWQMYGAIFRVANP